MHIKNRETAVNFAFKHSKFGLGLGQVWVRFGLGLGEVWVNNSALILKVWVLRSNRVKRTFGGRKTLVIIFRV